MRNEATCKATTPTCAGLAATLLASKHRHFLASHVEAASLVTACSRLIAWQLTRPLHINPLDVCVAQPVVERSSIKDAKVAGLTAKQPTDNPATVDSASLRQAVRLRQGLQGTSTCTSTRHRRVPGSDQQSRHASSVHPSTTIE